MNTPNSSDGGNARAAVLSPEQRKEIASRAARARWGATEVECVEGEMVPMKRVVELIEEVRSWGEFAYNNLDNRTVQVMMNRLVELLNQKQES